MHNEKTALDNKYTTSRDVVDTTNNNFYVDDCLKYVASEEEVVTLIKTSAQHFRKGIQDH